MLAPNMGLAVKIKFAGEYSSTCLLFNIGYLNNKVDR